MQRYLRAAFAAIAAVSLVSSVFVPQALAQGRTLPDFTDLVDKVGPAVVNIRTTQTVAGGRAGQRGFGGGGSNQANPFCEFFPWMCPPGQRGEGNERAPRRGEDGDRAPGERGLGERPAERGEEVPSGVGSGFVLSADGYIMTNAHVVRGADDIYVKLTDKREFKAKLIGADQRTDVAIIKIEAASLPAVTIGDSNRLRVGEWVIAIGSPFELENTVTAGIVSAKGRDTGEYVPFIQTDVAINPGNSGGPLINMRGEVVGINSMIYSRSGGYQGIAFAIPIDEAMRVGEQLKTGGRVSRGFLGVQPGAVTKDVAESLGLKSPAGAVVEKVIPGTAAEKAGLKEGDVILKFDGKNVEKHTDLPRIVGNTRPGQRENLVLLGNRHGWIDGFRVDRQRVIHPVAAGVHRQPLGECHRLAVGAGGTDLQRIQVRVEQAIHALQRVIPRARAGIGFKVQRRVAQHSGHRHGHRRVHL